LKDTVVEAYKKQNYAGDIISILAEVLFQEFIALSPYFG